MEKLTALLTANSVDAQFNNPNSSKEMKTRQLFSLVLGFALPLLASGQCQIVTLTQGNPRFAVDPSQVVTLLSANGMSNNTYCYLAFTNGGGAVSILPQNGFFSVGSATATGVTNIVFSSGANPGAVTFSIKTASAQNFVPANAVVIPSDATGPVQIILESSSDLVNWNAALPGTYGSTYSNRFFRVRAVVQH